MLGFLGEALATWEVRESLMRKYVRKILKRKDSDAGEKGRALEEVRASLFSKLRAFGSGKRQQTTLWGPTMAKIAVTPAIVLAEFVLFQKKISFLKPVKTRCLVQLQQLWEKITKDKWAD
ncbi:hypothetical protein RND71_042023 [Anisodus tanguticus]|uniref:Uncharacterized protein n=1 Tax=Anisodus tanguticus TaxID=243964 RepID=A0AAE1QPU9_9SOLA|nr:hypothetical protein RND71_042023 [Anisodus tanguticus]